MTNVIRFKPRTPTPADQEIWCGDCGCLTFYLYSDGRVQCAQCKDESRGIPDELRAESDIDDMHELLDEQYAGVRDALAVGEAYRPPPEPVVKLVPKAPEDDES